MSSQIIPDAVLIEVFLLSDIPTLGNLQLVCRSFHDLIEAYGNSIASAILSRSYAAEIISCFSIAKYERDPIKELRDINRRVCKARRMAALRLRGAGCRDQPAADIHLQPDFQPMLYIPLETIFEFLTIGLGVMWNVSAIATKALRKYQPSLIVVKGGTKNFNLTRGLPSNTVVEIEDQILYAQKTYVQNLSRFEQQGFHYTYLQCIQILHWAQAFVPHYSPHSSQRENERKNWVIWLILREGPDFIARGWSSMEEKAKCRDLIISELATRERYQLLIEQDHGKELHNSFRYPFLDSTSGEYQPTVDLDVFQIVADDFGREVIANWGGYEKA
jgi:hypothetical protein